MARSQKSRISADVPRPPRKAERWRSGEPADPAAEELTWLARACQENPDPVLRVSAEYVLLYRNPAGEELCRAWGCSLGQKVPTVIQRIVSAALADGAVARHEVVFGSHIYGLTGAPAVADGYVNLYARDITDYKRAQEALRQSEQRFRTIFDTTSDGIFLHDLETRKLTMCNKSFLQMLGYTEEEFLKLTVADLHTEEDLPFIHAQIDRFLQGRTPIRRDIRFKRKDGSILFVDLSPDLVVLDGKRYVVVALKDITERKRMEEELRQHAEHLEELVEARTHEVQESERKYRALVEKINDWVWEVDADGVYTYASPRALELLGYRPEEIVGKTPFDLMPPAEAQRVWNAFRPTWLARKPLELLESTLVRKDGGLVTVETSGMPVFAEDGAFRGYTGIDRDVTSRQQAQEALREKEYLLSESQRIGQIGSWSVDLVTHSATWTRETYHLFGVAPDTFAPSADALIGLLHPDDRDAMREWIRAALTGAPPAALEFRVPLPDGSVRVLIGRGELISGDDHRPLRLVGTAQDVTERQQAEEALRQLSRKNEEALRVACMGHWEFDFTSGTFTFNDQYYALHGTTAREAGGYQMTAEDFARQYVHPDDAHLVQESIQEAAAAEDPDFQFRTEARILRTDGGARWVTVWFRTEKDAQGKTTKLHGVNQDITERRRAEEARLESEERYRILLEHGFDGIFVHEDFRIVQLNDRLAEMAGCARSELAGGKFIGMFTPDSQERIRQYTRSGVDGYIELQLRRRDGRIVEVESYGAPCKFQGRNARIVGLRDITERKQAEEALRESEAGLAAAQRLAHIGSWQWNIAADTAHWSDETFRIFGLTRRPLQQHREGFISRVIPEDRQRVDQALSDALSGARDYDLDYRIRLPDGQKRVIHAQAQVLRNSDGQPIMMHGTVQDITERQRAEEALRESEERFRTAFEDGAVATALTALDSTLLKVNSAFCRMLGFRESELVGRSYTEITHPDDRAANLIGTRRLACGEISSFRMEKRYIRKDGAVIWGDMNTASVHNDQGRPLYCVTHVQDITERRQAEEALRSLNERLELQVAQRTEELRHTVDRLRQLTLDLSQAEDRERTRIADILHDDVQQTLAAAKFHLNLLGRETRSSEESQEIVEQVKQMLKDAIEKSRRLSHELSPALYQVDLTAILEWLARHMQEKHGLTVHVETHGPVDSPSEPLKAFLYKVAQELLFNVVKHAGVREARIQVRRLGPYLYLSVIDRGRGFDPQRLEMAPGFGLLGIRERVQLLGGRMKIKSAPGAGSRLLIALPYEPAARTQDAVPPGCRDASDTPALPVTP